MHVALLIMLVAVGGAAPLNRTLQNRTLLLILPDDYTAPAINAYAQTAAALASSETAAFNLITITSGNTPMRTFARVLDAFRGANISGIIGPPDSSEAVVLAAWASEVGVPVVSYSATAPSLGSAADYPNFLRVVADDGATLDAAVALLCNVNASRAAFLAQNDDFGVQGMSTFSAAAAAAGVAVLYTGTFAHDNCSLASIPVLNKAIASGARYFLLWAFPACSDAVMLAAAQLGAVGPAYVWVLASETNLTGLPASNRQFDGTLVVEAATYEYAPFADPTLRNAMQSALEDGYRAILRQPTTVYAPYAADAVFIVAAALDTLPLSWGGGLQQCLRFDRVMEAGTLNALMSRVRVWDSDSSVRKQRA